MAFPEIKIDLTGITLQRLGGAKTISELGNPDVRNLTLPELQSSSKIAIKQEKSLNFPQVSPRTAEIISSASSHQQPVPQLAK